MEFDRQLESLIRRPEHKPEVGKKIALSRLWKPVQDRTDIVTK